MDDQSRIRMHNRMNTLMGILEWALLMCLLFGCLYVFMLISERDWEDQEISRLHYCHKVDVWKASEHLPPEQRMGWPDFKGNYYESCF